ncbi:MAG TPA: DUF2279 domain-containing protein [Chitinophaga sp.]
MKPFLLCLCLLWLQLRLPAQQLSFRELPDTTVPARVAAVGGFSVLVYGGTLAALDQVWYKGYPRSKFHFFNDEDEWLGMDKFGHVYSTYLEAKYSREAWRWTGIPRKQQIWIGGLSALTFQTLIEVMDGYSANWGFSAGDMTANVAGAGAMISQELLWDEQRIQLKFSAHTMQYHDPLVARHANNIYGSNFFQRTLKDYNAQTYWVSVNVKAFAKESRWPAWLNIAAGYGADRMYNAEDNTWTDVNGVYHDYSNVARIRQFYLSPDIDFTKIPTRHKGLKIAFQLLNMLKFPAPALEINSHGTFKLHPVYF